MAELTGWSQHKQRFAEDDNHSGKFFTDQDGREFHAEVEIKTGDPCGPLVLCNPWARRAPWRPDSNYMVRTASARGRRAAGVAYDYEIDYPRLKKEAEIAWQERARKIGEIRAKFPQLDDAQIEVQIGKPPIHPAVFDLFIKKHPWLLGLRDFDPTDELDCWLQKYVAPSTLPVSFDWTGDSPPAMGAATADLHETPEPLPTKRRTATTATL